MTPSPQFPTYLLPSTFSLPFRRRHSSTTSATSMTSESSLGSSPTSSAITTPSSSPPNVHYAPSFLTAHSSLTQALHKIKATPADKEQPTLRVTAPNTLKCVTCASDIAFASQIVSKGFTGRHGRAYLVGPPLNPTQKHNTSELLNSRIGRSVNRELLTGAHVVADVSCSICGTVLGWKYVDAKETAQKYKIGKFILEMKRVVLAVTWEDGGKEVEIEDLERAGEEEDDDVVVFDSEDEDECDDLFAGTWDREVVAKRRAKRRGWKKRVCV
ncbi:yippee zinc-binding/DNA-binding /Mis18, centromere assembly-domain-containing protein [Amylocarpus encephaloides]|uniref:Yippee zinc-binding/DNA-binding /Mis18, centromere assembly-domain-containing protein n=1 Tax=Amylocarpus encephaloides TaxID=45428 RepID=A0A9P7YT78_9HELO|nr:yippee zinc-binding/DNA-binding /Mis18, centromere assembly-domain-containing protein [Amylocarpus encephaloides]